MGQGRCFCLYQPVREPFQCFHLYLCAAQLTKGFLWGTHFQVSVRRPQRSFQLGKICCAQQVVHFGAHLVAPVGTISKRLPGGRVVGIADGFGGGDFKEIVEPLRNLFKDEVRKVGLELGIPENLVFRQPFPGPGLAIRVIGDITKDKLDILRDADFIFRDEIAKAGLHKSINQYFAVLTNLRSVGVMGDERTYDYTLALRAVETTDFMTGIWSKIPYEILEKVSSRIVNEVKHINRVVYDITSKPPATIEWE